ncbi:ABC transporter ATP-binding protein [Candidatus Saccharibacteria bacterium]|nr:ABC transporter ATP-binding protein [Candidatus Saccharibacteria bacterium]
MLSVERVSYETEGKCILKNVNFEVAEGEFLVIIGPNGSGKSTLAKIVMGILSPTKGRIFWNEKDVTDLNVTERAKLGISYAFQASVRMKGITVKKILEIAGGSECAEKHLREVGLEPAEYLERDLGGELSGGERKRIEIASVLAKNADLMIFDEPEAGIDLWSFEDLRRVFKRLNKAKKTLIVISHQEKIIELADRILTLGNGNLKEGLNGLK